MLGLKFFASEKVKTKNTARLVPQEKAEECGDSSSFFAFVLLFLFCSYCRERKNE